MDYEDHLEQLYRRLGTRQPICVGCAEADPFCLELHHIGREKYHDDVSIVCRNCHRKLTVQQLYHVLPDTPELTGKLVMIGHYLLGLSDQYTMTAKTLRSFGVLLLNKSNTEQQTTDEDL